MLSAGSPRPSRNPGDRINSDTQATFADVHPVNRLLHSPKSTAATARRTEVGHHRGTLKHTRPTSPNNRTPRGPGQPK